MSPAMKREARVDLGGATAPFEADHKWDSMGQFLASPRPVEDSDELLTLAQHEQLSHSETGTINSHSKLMFLYG